MKKLALNQHGAYPVDQKPCDVEIIGDDCAVLRGTDHSLFPALIEEFRFHAPHITRFYDEDNRLVKEYPPPEILDVRLEQIQPSQFYVDEVKLAAVRSFVKKAEDIVIQVMPYGDRFISLDGHTRLFLAEQNDFSSVRAVISETDASIWTFVREAERRNILRPSDMILLPHDRYAILWDQYCDDVFARLEKKAENSGEE